MSGMQAAAALSAPTEGVMEVKLGYKLTDAGLIPEEWDVKSFGSLFSFSNGVNADKSSYGKGFRFVNVLEPITFSHIFGPEIPGRVDIPESVAAAYVVKKGDVLFNRTSETDAELGLAATYLGDEDIVFGGFVIRGRPVDGSLDPTYSGYALRAPIIRSQIIPMGQGAVRANIGQENLARVVVPVPPLPEQRAIAAALSDVDALLGEFERLIAKKRDLKQAAMQQLLTGQTRLPGFSGEWEVKLLGELAQLKNGYAFQSSTYTDLGSYKVVTIANVQDGFMTVEECSRIASLPQDIQTHQRLYRNDILISMTGNVGRVCRVSDDDCLLNQRVGKLVPNGVDEKFLFAILCQRKFLVSMMIKAKGGAQGNLAKSDITEFEVSLPPDTEEQAAIATILFDMDAELSALEARRGKTRALKQAMMQELLTGKTRLVPPGGANA